MEFSTSFCIIISCASIPTQQPDYTATALAVVVGLVLGLHVFGQPFYHPLESFCLFCAFAISILNVILSKPTYFLLLSAILSIVLLAPIPWLLYRFAKEKAPVTLKTERRLDSRNTKILSQKSNDEFLSGPTLPKRRRKEKRDMKKRMRSKRGMISKTTTTKAWKEISLGERKFIVIKKKDQIEESFGNGNNNNNNKSSLKNIDQSWLDYAESNTDHKYDPNTEVLEQQFW